MTAVRSIVRGGGSARGSGAALALFAFTVVGCSEPDGYDPAMRYPLRADRIVVQAPPAAPAALPPSGKLDESIAAFDSLGGKTLDPAKLTPDEKAALTAALDARFGTPANPTLPGDIALSPGELARGSVLYRRSCSQCHGLTGDGRGPTGPWLYPHPRDFRQGVFHASANTPGGKLRPVDLKRVIKHGVPGTSMPVFDLLPDADVDAIAAYVVHLSARGEAEFRAVSALRSGDGDAPAAEVAATTDKALSQWAAAATSDAPVPSIPVEVDADAVRRGHELFVGAAGCAACHVDYGRQDQFRYDVWGASGRVADLTRGEYRWGKSPEDLARRVKYGLPAAGMPANPQLSDDQIRNVVAFLRELPAPPRLPADLRQRVYP